MFALLNRINRSAFFWLALFALSLGQEIVALYYQYQLEYPPCELCVHTRAWVFAIAGAVLVGLWLRRSEAGLTLANGLTLLATIGLANRAYFTFGTERGFIMGDCGVVDAGFPSWLPLDQWLPAVFKPLEPCGVTPWLIQGFLSMADGLMIIGFGLVALVALMLVSQFIARR